MTIFKLIPVESEKQSQKWSSSTYKNEIIIRSESENRARQIAVLATCIATRRTRHKSPVGSPWKDSNLVECVSMSFTQEGWSQNGDEEILSPETLKAEWKHYQ